MTSILRISFAILISVTPTRMTNTSDIKTAIMEEKKQLYAYKVDNCNTDMLQMYFEDEAKPADDMKELCTATVTPCCSKANIESFIKRTSSVRNDFVEIKDWLKKLYGFMGGIKDEDLAKVKDISDLDSFRGHLKVEPLMLGETLKYIDNVEIAINSLVCTICDGKHGADFKVEDKMISSIDVQMSQCTRFVSSSLGLHKSLAHLGHLAVILQNVEVEHDESFAFDIPEFNKNVETNTKLYTSCLGQYKMGENGELNAVTTDCLEVCQNHIYFEVFYIPYNFIVLAHHVFMALKKAFGNQEFQVPVYGLKPSINVISVRQPKDSFTIKPAALGIDLSTDLLDLSHFDQTHENKHKDKKTQDSSAAKKMLSSKEGSPVMFFLSIVAIMGVIAIIVYLRMNLE